MPPRRILIVDPDPDTRELFRYCLSADGTAVEEAADGRDALVKALAHPPQLVVTEIILPYVEGHALCGILRQDQATARVPILVVTGDARPEVIALAKTAGADAVLIKPTTPDAILNEAQRLLTAAGTPRQHEGSDSAASDGASAEGGRATLTRRHQRFMTTTPPAPPPALLCPTCDAPLQYERSHVGGVSSRHPEQWDYYTCSKCGTFQFRHRTRRLRRT